MAQRPERPKREIVHQPEFSDAMREIYGQADRADNALFIVDWALQRDPDLIGLATADPSRRVLRLDPWLQSGQPRVVITYQFDDDKVYLIGANLSEDVPED